jgi:hypothetical protein
VEFKETVKVSRATTLPSCVTVTSYCPSGNCENRKEPSAETLAFRDRPVDGSVALTEYSPSPMLLSEPTRLPVDSPMAANVLNDTKVAIATSITRNSDFLRMS